MTDRSVLKVVALAAVVFLAWALWHKPSAKPTTNPVASLEQLRTKPAPIVTPAQVHGAKPLSIAADGTVPVPARFQLPGVERVRTASSFKDWVAQFSPEDQKTITAFGLRHFGVFSVNSPEQVAWMAQMGYPMPEDVLAAKLLSDQDLRSLAGRGNDKAEFLLHEREVDTLQARYAELAAQGKDRSEFWRNDPSATQYNKDDFRYDQLLMNSMSPFKGFVKAQDALLAQDPQDAPATVISGLLWAETYGDFRVDQFIDQYVGTDPTRMAILAGAQAMALNGTLNISALRGLGCPGFNVGNMIPGTVSPVQ